MARADDYMMVALDGLAAKPADTSPAPVKKAYSEQVSHCVAQAIAAELRDRGLNEARPAPPGELDRSGAERRMAGGIGAKKVDVTWATEESGLLLGISVKSINFKDARTGNFQKNLTNRRGDMLFEAVTLHRRFPYSVLGGLFFLDASAAEDDTTLRRSTFLNAHSRFGLFTGRDDPGGRDEQYERLYIVLLNADPSGSKYSVYPVGEPGNAVKLAFALDELVEIVAARNPDFYEYKNGALKRVSA